MYTHPRKKDVHCCALNSALFICYTNPHSTVPTQRSHLTHLNMYLSAHHWLGLWPIMLLAPYLSQGHSAVPKARPSLDK